MPTKRVLLFSWGTRGDAQPVLALALHLKSLKKEVHMFVMPPSDDMVRKAGVPCTTSSESFADLMEVLAHFDLSSPNICDLVQMQKTLDAFNSSEATLAKQAADLKAGYELAVSFKPDVIVVPGQGYGFFAHLGYVEIPRATLLVASCQV